MDGWMDGWMFYSLFSSILVMIGLRKSDYERLSALKGWMDEWMDGWMDVLQPFQQYFSHDRITKGRL